MTPIRVILIEIPHLLCEIIEELIERQPDIELVGTVGAGGDLPRALRRTRPEVIVCRAGATLPRAYCELFERHPHLRVLAIEDTDRTGFVYELRPIRAPLEVSPQSLVDAIRSTRTSGCRFSWIARAEDS
jgi:DNA-binding NarL/FixJ family response regulator